MASIYDDKDTIYLDEYEDYVIKKQKMNNARGIGRYHCRFNFENASLNAKDYDKEIGLGKESCEVAQDDDEFNSMMQERINAGIPRGWTRSRSNSLDRLLHEILDEDEFEFMEDDDDE